MATARKPVEPLIEDGWRPARLIPTTAIGGHDEQEQRATSLLLAVMGAVPEFGKTLLAHRDARPVGFGLLPRSASTRKVRNFQYRTAESSSSGAKRRGVASS